MLEVELTRRKRERKRERMGLLQMESKVPSIFSPATLPLLSLFPGPFSLALGVCSVRSSGRSTKNPLMAEGVRRRGSTEREHAGLSKKVLRGARQDCVVGSRS